MSGTRAASGRYDWSTMTIRADRQGRAVVVAAAWLIGLGLVLLAREVTGWSWTEAWPLFVILVGIEGLIALVFGLRRRAATAWSIAWSLAWLLVGIALLATTTGTISTGTLDLIGTWWPIVAIGLGLWLLVAAVLPQQSEAVEHVAVPLPPAVADARVVIQHGAGHLTIRAGTPGLLLEGECAGGVIVRTTPPNVVELRPGGADGWPSWLDRSLDWTLGLAPDYPISLRVDVGASRSDLELSRLLVPYLELHAGANDMNIALPTYGLTRVRIEAGAASISLAVPPSVAATIRARTALSSVNVDATRFRRTVDGYETVDVATNPNRAEIELQGAIAAIRVF